MFYIFAIAYTRIAYIIPNEITVLSTHVMCVCDRQFEQNLFAHIVHTVEALMHKNNMLTTNRIILQNKIISKLASL